MDRLCYMMAFGIPIFVISCGLSALFSYFKSKDTNELNRSILALMMLIVFLVGITFPLLAGYIMI